MKTALLLLTLVLSTQNFAHADIGLSVSSTIDTTLLPFALTSVTGNLSSMTSSGEFQKQAAQIMQDGNEYLQDGSISAYLNQNIIAVQAQNSDLSVDESVDVLMTKASEILN